MLSIQSTSVGAHLETTFVQHIGELKQLWDVDARRCVAVSRRFYVITRLAGIHGNTFIQRTQPSGVLSND